MYCDPLEKDRSDITFPALPLIDHVVIVCVLPFLNCIVWAAEPVSCSVPYVPSLTIFIIPVDVPRVNFSVPTVLDPGPDTVTELFVVSLKIKVAELAVIVSVLLNPNGPYVVLVSFPDKVTVDVPKL